MLDLATEKNIIQKSGAWYAYNGEKIGQGRENAKLYLAEHPEVLQELENKVREANGLAPKEPVGAVKDSGEVES